MSDKVRLFYILDIVIAIAFLLTAISSVVFLFGGSGGYEGGRNADFQTEMLGISRWTWKDLHTWTGLVMIAGAALHILLHWNWIVCATRRVLQPPRVAKTDESCQII